MIGPVSSSIEGGFAVPTSGVDPSRPGGPEESPVTDEQHRGRLWEASKQMEGVFVQYLMKALRDTVPNQGNADAPGADMYGSLLDEHLAQVVANDTSSGVAEALYRQLASAAAISPEGGADR